MGTCIGVLPGFAQAVTELAHVEVGGELFAGFDRLLCALLGRLLCPLGGLLGRLLGALLSSLLGGLLPGLL
ncbi:Uncharacterised protein [Mycobacteroides abscessus]|nr:Uncharacterised protein [Mycobacteroides abscessus]CRG62271.1 Uncharacterised protein [Mycobacteroides abscessus]